MFRPEKSKIPNFRADYAKHADFCEVFQRDMNPLYLLAFLLTANHKEAEKCFALTVEKAFKESAVFKEWARSRVKRSLIENAIDIVSPTSARIGEKRDLWSAEPWRRRDRCCDQTRPAGTLRLCHVDSGAQFQLGLRSVAWMQHK
jgi:hypothetical protein